MTGGPAWTYNEENGQYYLHLFSAGQPDLNMDNPRVRDRVKDVMRYWLDMGVDGFREDVITLISMAEGLPNDRGPLSLPKGRQYYDCGPHLADYLGEFRHDVLAQHDCFVVGEAPFVDVEKARMLTQGPRESRLLDMVFSFEHMEADCLFTEYIPLPFSPRRLMRALSRWQDGLHGVGWNALYLENHDHPRVISRYGSERYRRESGSMLACAYLFLEGTPFVYQGQEIGMTNISLPTIEDYPDCIAQANYRSYVGKMGEEKALARVRRATRDNARTPMQWDATPNAGFSTHEPWFAVNPNYREVNVAVQGNDENSLLNFYRRAIELRTKSTAVRWGEYHEFLRANGSVYAYSREFAGDDEHETETLLVVCCFEAGTAWGCREVRGRPHGSFSPTIPWRMPALTLLSRGRMRRGCIGCSRTARVRPARRACRLRAARRLREASMPSDYNATSCCRHVREVQGNEGRHEKDRARRRHLLCRRARRERCVSRLVQRRPRHEHHRDSLQSAAELPIRDFVRPCRVFRWSASRACGGISRTPAYAQPAARDLCRAGLGRAGLSAPCTCHCDAGQQLGRYCVCAGRVRRN